MDAGNRFERVRAAIEQLGPADHVCTLYDQRDEEVAIAVSYIRAGVITIEPGPKSRADAASTPVYQTPLMITFLSSLLCA
jgi:hypothetical protein